MLLGNPDFDRERWHESGFPNFTGNPELEREWWHESGFTSFTGYPELDREWWHESGSRAMPGIPNSTRNRPSPTHRDPEPRDPDFIGTHTSLIFYVLPIIFLYITLNHISLSFYQILLIFISKIYIHNFIQLFGLFKRQSEHWGSSSDNLNFGVFQATIWTLGFFKRQSEHCGFSLDPSK